MNHDLKRSSTQVYRTGGMAFRNFHTQSPKMNECLTLAERAAETDFAILITGESGTGKTLLAQAIHNASKRHRNPFVCINMSALSEGVLESELFGHEKGAFTGAARQRIGHFEKADGGTLLLDEIADMSLAAQPKILHAVEYKQFQRVGGETMIHADVRILSCTHCDLATLAESRYFRHDLLYRLQELVIRVPPLRERLEDLPELCVVLLAESERAAGLPPMRMSREALLRMGGYGWPGNIRELKSVVRRAGMVAGGGVIRAEHLGLPEKRIDVVPRPQAGDESIPPEKMPPLPDETPRPTEADASGSRGDSLYTRHFQSVAPRGDEVKGGATPAAHPSPEQGGGWEGHAPESESDRATVYPEGEPPAHSEAGEPESSSEWMGGTGVGVGFGTGGDADGGRETEEPSGMAGGSLTTPGAERDAYGWTGGVGMQVDGDAGGLLSGAHPGDGQTRTGGGGVPLGMRSPEAHACAGDVGMQGDGGVGGLLSGAHAGDGQRRAGGGGVPPGMRSPEAHAGAGGVRMQGDGGVGGMAIRLEEVEARHIAWVMGLVGGNKTRAARLLGIARSTLDRKLTRHRPAR